MNTEMNDYIARMTADEHRETNVKQVVIVRRDLDMSKGKLAAQVAHASIAWLTDKLRSNGIVSMGLLSPPQAEWIDGPFKKIVVWVKDEAEFWQIVKAASFADLATFPILDQGVTVFSQATWTTAGIGPDYDEKLKPITGHLQLCG